MLRPKHKAWATLSGYGAAHPHLLSPSLLPSSQGDQVPPSPPVHAGRDGVHGRCHLCGLLPQH